MSLVAASALFSYVIGYYTVYLRSQPCLTNIQIAKNILGSPYVVVPVSCVVDMSACTRCELVVY